MQSNYKRLGDYIQEVNIRNKDLKQYPLLGVSIRKEMMTSIANTVGTDMSTYKIIQKNQFAYGPVTSRNGDKISIALSCEEKALLSQAYVVFETNNELLPEYLMMWFRRPEFDRYARYKSHGSAREIFDWQEMSEVMLPIPSVEKQQEMVNEYHTIQNRINLNNQLIAKLEETAQTIYKQWFVDFEFPTESHCEERGTSDEAISVVGYKSSGGKMVWCEELEKEIPEGWEVGNFQNELIFKTGKLDSNASVSNGKYPFFTCSEEVFKVDSYAFEQEAVLLGGNNATGKFPLKYFNGKFDAYQRTYVISSNHKRISNKQIYYRIKGLLDEMRESSVGTTTKFLTMQIFNPISIIIPNILTYESFEKIMQRIYNSKQVYFEETQKLEELKELLLGRMVRS